MNEVMQKHDLNPEQWARLTRERCPPGTHASTITRALSDDYRFVTKPQTLRVLAESVGEQPPVIGANMQSAGDTIPLPTPEALRAIVRTHYEQVRGRKAGEELVTDLARRLHGTLSHLLVDPDAARVPEAAHTAALLLEPQSAAPEPPEDDE